MTGALFLLNSSLLMYTSNSQTVQVLVSELVSEELVEDLK